MTEPRGILRHEFVPPLEAGNAVSLVIRDLNQQDFVFVLGAEKLPGMIGGLLRMAIHPAISQNFEKPEGASIGSRTNVIPVPYARVGAAFVESSGKVGLFVGFPEEVQFCLALESPTTQQPMADSQLADRTANRSGKASFLN